ncbi:glucose-6-phosphate dehydrogenase (NADP(+)) [Acetobacteraceae bacterium]|nr:glucose-6-phosphate dehydrogenase (NADP(+)) [Candidatus Parcubacteria bacterium]
MQENEKPVIFIPFGATGDLMRIKVLPALFELFTQGSLPKNFRAIGFSHRNMDAQAFRGHVREMIETYKGKAISPEALLTFTTLFDFVRGEFDEVSAYQALRQKIAETEKELGASANILFYFSVAPQFYGKIAAQLKDADLLEEHTDAWTRVVIEKPFGTDGKSAQALEESLAGAFKEEQMYRIDHYLAKEVVRNNPRQFFLHDLTEPYGKEIESIRIELLEEIGVEKRGAFYDPLGAFRDVGQNHILEVLAFLIMEEPSDVTPPSIRSARAKALEALPIFTSQEVAKHTFRGQYEGYRTIPNVDPQSHTETYYKILLTLTDERWSGVSVVMESGKRVGPAHKEITVTLKNGEKRVSSLESKVHYTGEYTTLILEALRGDQTFFISKEEVAAMWRFADPILQTWHTGNPELQSYTPDTREIVQKSKEIENS